MKKLLLSALCTALLIAPATARAPAPQTLAAQAAVDELMAADRAFATAASGTDTASALAAMFDADIIMPMPNGAFARGKAAAATALHANAANLRSSAAWQPIRGGVSADGQHGFTYGYMTVKEHGAPERRLKYLSYWVKRPEGWRVAAYRRAPRPEGEVAQATLPPVLPSSFVDPQADATSLAQYRDSLKAAERAFSDEAQRIGLGAAFTSNGSAEAMNMGTGPGFTFGAENIGREVQKNAPAALTWGPDDALVASSGDLGFTWGRIHLAGQATDDQPGFSFFTVWRRADPQAKWQYIAE